MQRLAKQSRYTYGDYLEWSQEGRCELIDGLVYDMTPAPSRRHQKILVELSRQISNHFFGGSPCEVYVAPFDVRLPDADEADEMIGTVVQPDISVICERAKLDDRGCRGAPDWIIEIVSPSTVTQDFIRKLALYEKHGVREYWIAHPVDKIVMIYRMNEGGLYGRPGIYSEEDKVESAVIGGLVIDLKEVFAP